MFGTDIFSSSIISSATICLFAGVLSFLSPCVLPILPPYLAYMAGTTISEIKNNNETIRGVLLSAIKLFTWPFSCICSFRISRQFNGVYTYSLSK